MHPVSVKKPSNAINEIMVSSIVPGFGFQLPGGRGLMGRTQLFLFSIIPRTSLLFGGRVQGWGSVCSGVRWFLVSWFQSFLVSWFQGFMASWLLASWFQIVCWFLCILVFDVSGFLGFKFSQFQRFNDPILQYVHFMLSARYLFHIQDF